MDKVNIALLGFGNVGRGVWKILQENKKEIMERSNVQIEISKILVKDMKKDREIAVPEGILTDDIEKILQDESIKIVVELTGAAEMARDFILEAMRRNKHVVTANKLVLAKWGEELFNTARQEKVLFYYEASVGGGIPIIREINESLTANRIQQITGIINGTTNYILSKMIHEGIPFEEALKEAQHKGYAESDPTSDIEGYDALYKLSILSSLAFGTVINHQQVYREGIKDICSDDIKYAQKFGYTIKLLAIAKEEEGKLELRVHPTLVPANHPIANVNDTFNAIYVKGNAVGDLMLYGRGAGDLPTGSAVVGDIISILRNSNDKLYDKPHTKLPVKEIKPIEESKSEFYIRLNVIDKAGVLSQIAGVFGEYNVSILSVTQDVKHQEHVSLVFITHTSLERDIRSSLEKIQMLQCVNRIESVIRIEQFE